MQKYGFRISLAELLAITTITAMYLSTFTIEPELSVALADLLTMLLIAAFAISACLPGTVNRYPAICALIVALGLNQACFLAR